MQSKTKLYGLWQVIAFICWVVCKDKLRTKDRLKRWGVVDDDMCVLCGENVENKEHLFFNCCYSRRIWESVLCRKETLYRCNNWEEVLAEAANRYRCNFAARMGKITVEADVHLAREKPTDFCAQV